MLTPRALKYLSNLERRAALSTQKVEKIIKDSGFPCFDVWLDFHERFAGYVEPLGLGAEAEWGLAHEKNHWIGDRSVFIKQEPNEDTWQIMCANVHPSFEYMLDNRGEFLGTHAESFDIHVERIAMLSEFYTKGKAKRIYGSELEEYDFSFIKEDHLIKEASDKYFNYYEIDNKLIGVNIVQNKVKRMWKLL